jgi:hypothetical protein
MTQLRHEASYFVAVRLWCLSRGDVEQRFRLHCSVHASGRIKRTCFHSMTFGS